MALFANDKEDIVDAYDADAKIDYTCLECQGKVRLRKGKLQIPHFYHLRATPSCRLYSKSERHLLIQIALQKQLPLSEAVLEKPFSAIGRIADVAWEKQRIVFEIQCSSIAKEEAQSRISEYGSLGYSVVWILDDRLFNQRRVSLAESFLREKASLFVTGKGPFLFYDQAEQIEEGIRIRKGKRLLTADFACAAIGCVLRKNLDTAPKERPMAKQKGLIKTFFQKYIQRLDQWLYRK